jgi:hypothetical protein
MNTSSLKTPILSLVCLLKATRALDMSLAFKNSLLLYWSGFIYAILAYANKKVCLDSLILCVWSDYVHVWQWRLYLLSHQLLKHGSVVPPRPWKQDNLNKHFELAQAFWPIIWSVSLAWHCLHKVTSNSVIIIPSKSIMQGQPSGVEYWTPLSICSMQWYRSDTLHWH